MNNYKILSWTLLWEFLDLQRTPGNRQKHLLLPGKDKVAAGTWV